MSVFMVSDADNRAIVAIGRDGKVTLHPDVEIDEAARQFWAAVEKEAQRSRNGLLSTRELGPELTRLGLIPKKAKRVLIDLAPDSPVRMYYEVLADRTLLDVFPALAAACLQDRERAAKDWEEFQAERAARVNDTEMAERERTEQRAKEAGDE